MKKILLLALSVMSLSAFANDGDLTIPGERWVGKFTGFVCGDGNVQATVAPAEFAAKNIVLGRMTTDYALDNGVIKATFEENGVTCNYSAIMFADNAAWTLKRVESKAYSLNGGSECLEGKAVLDSALEFNKYVYLHGRIAIWSPVAGAEVSCGAGAETVGLHFQVTGKL